MKRIVVSGFFNPLHGGHLDMIEEAAAMGDHLTVIVNNDDQQIIKKGMTILSQDNRLRLMRALGDVDQAVIAIDSDATVIESLKLVRLEHPDDTLIFANGGDRDSNTNTPESAVCADLRIEMVYGVGGVEKADSSTRINRALGYKK